MTVTHTWRGEFSNASLNDLHGEAFGHEVLAIPWQALLQRHSFGWVTAHDEDGLVGFLNVVWDGDAHAWLQDVIVARRARGGGVGKRMVEIAANEARRAGCEWLHVDFEEDLRPFYIDACGFEPTPAGVMRL